MKPMTEQWRQELIERLKKIAAWEKTYGAQNNVMLPASEAREIAEIALAFLNSVKAPMMFIDGDISPDSADKLAKVFQEFNAEEERPLAKMARIIRENPHPTNECDMPTAPPVPVIKFPDHDVREFVNELTATAKQYAGAQCLRDVLSKVVKRRLNGLGE